MALTPESVARLDASRYIESQRAVPISVREQQFQNLLKLLRKYRALDSSSRILEIGTGQGWFQVLCLRLGIPCEGIELSPQLVESAKALGRSFGVDPQIRMGNVESSEIGVSLYDAIVADSVFEHVRDWKNSLRKVYAALKPGGVFYFSSTNKFSWTSGEYPKIPLYGWFPDGLRYWMRARLQGPDVVTWGIDFHQFRYSMLRRYFQELGFTDIFDFVEMKDGELNYPSAARRTVLKIVKSNALAKRLLLTFLPTTVFLCRK